MTLIPLLIDANPLLTLGFRQCLELGLESVGEVAFGRYMRKKMRDIGEVGSLGAESAFERDSGRVTLEELHGCNGGHYLGSGGQSGSGDESEECTIIVPEDRVEAYRKCRMGQSRAGCRFNQQLGWVASRRGGNGC